MGDHLAAIDMGRKEGAAACAPFGGGKLGPHLTQCGLGEAYLRTKWHHDPSSRLATIVLGQKLGALPPILGRGAGSPSSTMWPGPTPTSVPSAILIHPGVWSQKTWAENSEGSAPFLGRGSWVPSNTKSLGPRPTSIPSGMLIHAAIWPQQTYRPKIGDRTGQTDVQDRQQSDSIWRTVFGRPFVKTVHPMLSDLCLSCLSVCLRRWCIVAKPLDGSR